MGNSLKGDLYIQTDQPCYYQGETVTGKVFLHLKSPFDFDVLSLKVKGFEETKWQEEKTRSVQSKGADGEETNETETYIEDYDDKKTFFSQKFPLMTFPGKEKLQPGQYTFPFQFKLQDQLPGSFHEKGHGQGIHGEYKAAIKYKVKAEIIGHDEKIKNKQELVVRELVRDYAQGQCAEKIVKPTTWCCVKQGEAQIKCYFQKNSYVPGETAYLCADLDNSKCSLNMTDMTVSFNKKLVLKAKKHERVVKVVVQRCKFNGILAGEKAINENRRQAQILLMNEKKIPIPPSTNGKLINCSYDLNVIANLSGCICCASEPEVTLPLNIFSPPPVNYGVVTAPPNWNPQVYEVKSFAFSDQYSYNYPQQNTYPTNPTYTQQGLYPTQQNEHGQFENPQIQPLQMKQLY